MKRSRLLIACLIITGALAFPAGSPGLEVAPSLPPLPPLVIISPVGPKATKYAIIDNAKMKADPKAYLDPLRFVVWKGESEAEVAAFLKQHKIDKTGWLEFFGAPGSKLPDEPTVKAVIAKFKALGIEVLAGSRSMGPGIYDPPAEGAVEPKR